MMTGHLERPFTRQKRTMSGDIEEYQPDIKAYRFLMSLFADNINSFTRTNRDVLGQIEIIPKIKICREEHFLVNQQLERVYKKIEEKVSRDAIARNGYLKRGYEQFSTYYFNSHPGKDCRAFINQMQTISTERNIFTVSPSKKTTQPLITNPVKRPQSSKQEKPTVVIANIDKAFNNFNYQVAQIFKMKTINHSQMSDINPEHSRPEKRYLMSSQRGAFRQEFTRARKNFIPKNIQPQQEAKRYDHESSNVTFNGNEIVICDRRPKTNQERPSYSNNSGIFKGKTSNKRIMSIKMAHRKSIDEIERMQIQSKLMMINSAMTINPTQSQGYKAKSKCWQNYFN